MPMPSAPNPCLYYFVHLTELGTPISGTMFAKTNNKIDKGLKCREARLPATQMTVPAGKTQCFGKGHLRYFYKVSKTTGQILPNSFFSREGKPKSMCSGIYNILEYIIYN